MAADPPPPGIGRLTAAIAAGTLVPSLMLAVGDAVMRQRLDLLWPTLMVAGTMTFLWGLMAGIPLWLLLGRRTPSAPQAAALGALLALVPAFLVANTNWQAFLQQAAPVCALLGALGGLVARRVLLHKQPTRS
jgi:peptidoglycan/LPS O-acetylase OafA/YrhL